MANLGTLWFGSDIDLNGLKNKIQSGNQSILDALKINYDPASYQQMVTKLRTELSKETFEIKINTNATAVQQSLQNTIGNITNGASASGKGIFGMKMSMADLREEIILQTEKVQNLRKAWLATARAHGSDTIAAKNARKAYEDERDILDNMRRKAGLLGVDTRRASLAQAELNKQAKESAKALRQLNTDSIRLNSTLAGGIHVSTQLGSALSSLFAIDAARQFLGKVIEIGGQLEKQRISIGAILGDTVKANHLFEQIKGLALKSPFGVVELDQYTKQLSAYGFQYNELFDMTKRLADISAGAGTDIGRLTLALGHVRSATYLTGITLRQFSMNNIPMLKMLADYYTEVEKKAVSTADVQKRISKRQVSYEDVIEQIRRLTDEGGMFYNMQEKISESLSAKYKNLKDAMDIMYGEMAEGKIGDVLKGVADALLQVTRHWKEIGAVMAVAGGAFMLSRMRLSMLNSAMTANSAITIKKIMADKRLAGVGLQTAATYRTLSFEERRRVATMNQLTAADIRAALAREQLTKEDVLALVAMKKLSQVEAMQLVGINKITAAEIRAAYATSRWKVALTGLGVSLKNAFMSIGKGTWFTIASMVGMELYMAWNQWVSRIDDKANEMKDLVKSRIVDLQKMQKTLNTEGKPNDDTALKGRVDEMKQVLANSEAYTKTIDEQLSKTPGLKQQYDILADAIDTVVEKNKKMLDYQDSIAGMIKASKSDFDWWDLLKAGVASPSSFVNIWNQMFNEDIATNMKDTLNAYKDLRSVIDGAWEYKDAIAGVIEEMLKSKDVSKDFKEQLKDAPFEEQIRLLAESGYWDMVRNKVIALKPEFKDFAEDLKDAAHDVTDEWSKISGDDIPKMMNKLAKERGVDEEKLRRWALDNIDDFKMMLDGISDQLGVKEPEIRRRINRLFYDYVAFGELDKGLAEGLAIGANIVDNSSLQKLLQQDELANISDESSSSGKDNKNKKDKVLEAAKTRLQEYQSFLSEYKKYREHYSKEKAINILEQLFPNLKGQGLKLVDNYASMLDKLRDSMSMTTEARKKFADQVNKTKADAQFDREKESIKESTDAIEEYTKRMKEQWNLYRSLLKKSGGNEEFAQLAFNSNGAIWDETAKEMLERFNQLGKKLGVEPVAFDWSMDEGQLKEALVDAKGKIRGDLVKLATEIQEVIRGNYKKFLEESADAYNKSLTAAQKLVELEGQRRDLVKKRDTDNSEENRKVWDAQIAYLDKQIADQKWEAFKETEDWGRIFANLDNISTNTLQNMLDKLRELLPSIKDSTEGTKALYEAMDKIQEKLADRSPFSAIFGSINNANALRKYRNQATKGDILANADLSRLLGVKLVSKVTKNQLDDALKNAEGQLGKGLEGLAKKFKDIQDVLQPVIDLFETLGDEGLSDFFSMGNNAFGAAASVAGGLNNLGLGNLGPYGAAAAAAISVATSLLSLHDKSLQKEIEASEARQKEMENLTKNLEKTLERALGGVYTASANGAMLKSLRKEIASSTVIGLLRGEYKSYIGKDTIKAVENAEKTKSYYDATYASLLAQRDELQHQMSLEQDKKDSDSDKLSDYRQQLEEMSDEIENFALDMANALYDIDLKSWAKELTETIVDAWKNGEDAVDAYKNKVKEMMLDLTTNILSQKVMEQVFSDIGLDKLIADLMNKTSGRLDEAAVGALADALNQAGALSADTITAILDAMASKGYINKGTETESATVSGGIKSITENTADLLASYINAIRADVSIMSAGHSVHIPAISMAVQRTSVLAEAQVMQLTSIADNTLRNAEAAEGVFSLLRSATMDKNLGLYVK